MSAMQIVVVVLGAAVGYWLVSLLLNKKAKPESPTWSAGSASGNASGGNAWFQVLEVSQYASAEEVRAAYQRLISQYHPDKVATLGADLRALAEAKSKDINAAYREAMRLKGAAE